MKKKCILILDWQFIFFEISFYVKLMQSKVGAFNKLRETTHASIHAVRRGSNGIWSHVDCCNKPTISMASRRKKGVSAIHFQTTSAHGTRDGGTGILSPDGKRGRGSSASPQTSLLPLTAPSQRMRRSFFDPGHALDFLRLP